MSEHRPEVLRPHGEDDFVSRKYPTLADEGHVREAGVAVSHRQVLPETSGMGNMMMNKISFTRAVVVAQAVERCHSLRAGQVQIPY